MELGAILSIIQDFKIRTFVEIGIDQGGLASFLIARERIDSEFTYCGVELEPKKLDLRIRPEMSSQAENGKIFFGDVFSAQALLWLKNIRNTLADPFLFFCDDGDKPREVKLLSDLARTNDVILVHDFNKEIKIDDIPIEMRWNIQPDYFQDTRLFFMRGVAN